MCVLPASATAVRGLPAPAEHPEEKQGSQHRLRKQRQWRRSCLPLGKAGGGTNSPMTSAWPQRGLSRTSQRAVDPIPSANRVIGLEDRSIRCEIRSGVGLLALPCIRRGKWCRFS